MAIRLNQCVDGTISQLNKKRKLSPKDLESQEILEALQFEDFKITIFGNGALEPYFFILNASGTKILYESKGGLYTFTKMIKLKIKSRSFVAKWLNFQ